MPAAAAAPVATPAGSSAAPWWREAVIYEMYVRSFADGTGDGVGDLVGIREHLGHLVDLGVDALWVTPFYPSPMVDHGYDVADYRDVDPAFGTLEDAEALVQAAHARGLRIVVDVVPNHTSDHHRWFVEALQAAPGSPARARYLFRDGRGPYGDEPPNNWRSTFGGSAWTRVPDGQWYLHLFSPGQPDLDWTHPEVREEFESILRFWLDRGVDGFRVDVAHALAKAEGLPDTPEGHGTDLFEVPAGSSLPMWDQEAVHDVYRGWRRVLDSYDGERMAVGEIWVPEASRLARYVRPDELHQAFSIAMALAPWDADAFRTLVEESVAAHDEVGAAPSWVLSNHDVVRHVTRYGGAEHGRARARAALLLMLALPGSAYLYAGEELGLPEVDVPPELRQDPVWERSGGTATGRDGCRVPLPWTAEPGEPPHGFSSRPGQPWLPQPPGWERYAADAQRGDESSVYVLYRRALFLRGELWRDGGPMEWLPTVGEDVLSWRRARPGGGWAVCVVNMSGEDHVLPAGELLLASEPSTHLAGGVLPAETAAWLSWTEEL